MQYSPFIRTSIVPPSCGACQGAKQAGGAEAPRRLKPAPLCGTANLVDNFQLGILPQALFQHELINAWVVWLRR